MSVFPPYLSLYEGWITNCKGCFVNAHFSLIWKLPAHVPPLFPSALAATSDMWPVKRRQIPKTVFLLHIRAKSHNYMSEQWSLCKQTGTAIKRPPFILCTLKCLLKSQGILGAQGCAGGDHNSRTDFKVNSWSFW